MQRINTVDHMNSSLPKKRVHVVKRWPSSVVTVEDITFSQKREQEVMSLKLQLARARADSNEHYLRSQRLEDMKSCLVQILSEHHCPSSNSERSDKVHDERFKTATEEYELQTLSDRTLRLTRQCETTRKQELGVKIVKSRTEAFLESVMKDLEEEVECSA